ncbi:diguanylate cyclase [Alteriqipengyuania sp.]|uniref:sensor domain-containing diguanylate cyclase n=1 Tax=Alteriqipengyuania sp. TaxID=2800692 RepID=UPI003511C8E8
MVSKSILEGREGLKLVSLLIKAMQAFICLGLAAVISLTVVEGGWRIGIAVAAGVALAIVLAASLVSERLKNIQVRSYKNHVDSINRTQEQIEELFAMTDTLQAADSNADAAQVLRATSRKLLPGCGVALYVFNNSRDRLDLIDSWDMPESYQATESLIPANCWALKRGKDHLNNPHERSLCCSHYIGDVASIEVPMMARGQVFGLLVLGDRGGKCSNVDNARRIARALADSTSLALSNISLREQLRTQSLRDPMTGLYNRRYMEDTLERFISLAQRQNQSTSVLMIDLDNFKRLNDEHGHAKGDAVLKDVAAQVVGALRPSDVVCRYGGEELLVILPDCGLEDAMMRAEQVRARIELLSEQHGASVAASIGVATMPETAKSAADLLSASDAALYEAKAAGKNQVHASPPMAHKKQGTEPISPRLVANAGFKDLS